jgi:hypothetical protein
MGHPGESTDIGMEKHFHIPGQDVVWRWVLPGKTSLEGHDATAAKCASSAMVHLRRRFNSNEIFGAYGHELTYEEMKWLSLWCLVRGQNLLIPHAFYYSLRGPRRDERPPDVGPNAAWWPDYQNYAEMCRRLSWLNTDSKQIADVAILCNPTSLPERAAKICYEHQWDFNYLEVSHLENDFALDEHGLHIGDATYQTVIIDGSVSLNDKTETTLKRLAQKHKLIFFKSTTVNQFEWQSLVPHLESEEDLTSLLNQQIKNSIHVSGESRDLRYRHVQKEDGDFYFLFNEGSNEIKVAISPCKNAEHFWFDPFSKEIKPYQTTLVKFKAHEIKILFAKR